MGRVEEGIAFLVRLILLLLCWGLIAALVSPELAAAMGVAIFVLWLIVFVPWAALKAKKNAPPPLPPEYYAPKGSGSPTGNDLMLTDAPGGKLPDIAHEFPEISFPQHIAFEPFPEKPFFRRTLVLPVAAVIMLIAVWQGGLLNALSDNLGVGAKLKDVKLTAPDGEKENILAAARLALRREGGCTKMLGGRVAPADQLSAKKDGAFVYEFRCAQAKKTDSTYLVWVEPGELTPLPWPALTTMFKGQPARAAFDAACQRTVRELLAKNGVQPSQDSVPTLNVYGAGAPYSAYTRGVLVLETSRVITGGLARITASCWMKPDGAVSVRFGGN